MVEDGWILGEYIQGDDYSPLASLLGMCTDSIPLLSAVTVNNSLLIASKIITRIHTKLRTSLCLDSTVLRTPYSPP